jgi:hypothetical protein
MNKEQNSDNPQAQQLNIAGVSVSLFDTLAFAEWVDIFCVRNNEHEWKYRGDNYTKKYTTEQMYVIYYNER